MHHSIPDGSVTSYETRRLKIRNETWLKTKKKRLNWIEIEEKKNNNSNSNGNVWARFAVKNLL